MPNEPFHHHLPDVWQSQPVAPLKVSPDELRLKAKRFQTRIRARNVLEYAAGAYVVAANGWFLLSAGSFLMRLGCVLIIAGVFYVTYQIYRKGSAKPLPAQMGMAPCLEFHRKELQRQCELLSRVWSWYLAPLVPGLAVITLARAMGSGSNSRIIAILFSLAVAIFFYFIWKLNRNAARQLQRQIDELENL